MNTKQDNKNANSQNVIELEISAPKGIKLTQNRSSYWFTGVDLHSVELHVNDTLLFENIETKETNKATNLTVVKLTNIGIYFIKAEVASSFFGTGQFDFPRHTIKSIPIGPNGFKLTPMEIMYKQPTISLNMSADKGIQLFRNTIPQHTFESDGNTAELLLDFTVRPDDQLLINVKDSNLTTEDSDRFHLILNVEKDVKKHSDDWEFDLIHGKYSVEEKTKRKRPTFEPRIAY